MFHAIQSYGIARGAGGTLRIVRVRRGRTSPVASGPADSPAVREALAAIDREVNALKAVLAVPWPIGKTVSRTLVSPFASRAKSARIWRNLLDLTLPFPVEDAELDVTELPSEDGRARAFAQVVRRTDLERERAAWERLGIRPTHAMAVVPELRKEAAGGELVVLSHDAALWLAPSGEPRVVRWAAEADDAGKEQLLKTRLAPENGAEGRVLTWAGDGAEKWAGRAEGWGIAARHRVHSAGEDLPAVAAARRAAEDAGAANPLRGHPALVAKEARARTRGMAAAVALAAVVALGGIWAAGKARSDAAALGARAAKAAEALVGRAVPPGSERLMADRSRGERSVLLSAAEEATSPGAERTLAEVLAAFGDGGDEIASLAASPGGFRAEGRGPVETAAGRLREAGWKVEVARRGDGWTVEGEKR
jgi:hypothetical protein